MPRRRRWGWRSHHSCRHTTRRRRRRRHHSCRHATRMKRRRRWHLHNVRMRKGFTLSALVPLALSLEWKMA
jgi:hypothetical protein